VAGRRGWRLKIYGKGWEAHPTLSAFAAGLTDHGEELRAAYQCAAVNLHLCLSTLMHQRPMECALSGGLPVVRPTRDALSSLRARAQQRVAESGAEPFAVDPELGMPLYSFAECPEGMRLAALAQRLGMAERPGLLLPEKKLADLRRRRAVEPLETDPAWLLGDLAEISFVDEPSLERLVERAIDQPEWRRDVSQGIAGRVRDRLTHTALARRIIEAVGRRAQQVAADSAASGVHNHA
jgi:hypothetical protein